MADNSYNIEIKPASPNGYHTPQEARAYYGRYDRMGITVHWWGDGTGASNHDNIVNYMNSGSTRGEKSVNYVLSDNKITMCVNPDNVAWCSQSGNPVTVSVETQPTLGGEGYKRFGWLVDQLEQRYGRSLQLFPHKHWFATACPGTLNIGRIREEADKWKRGDYDAKPAPVVVAPTPAPAPPAPPKTVQLTIKDLGNKKVQLVRDANVWDLQFTKYADAKAVRTLSKDTVNAGGGFEVSAVVTHPLGSQYYISEYSYAKGIPNGINVKDTDYPDPAKLNEPVSVPPVVVTAPIQPPAAPTPADPPVVDPNKAVQERLTALESLVAKLKELLKGA